MLNKDSLQKALDDYNKLRDSLHPCSNGGCLVKEPVGMHTNSSCKCHKDFLKAQRMMYAGKQLAKEVEALLGNDRRELTP